MVHCVYNLRVGLSPQFPTVTDKKIIRKNCCRSKVAKCTRKMRNVLKGMTNKFSDF